MNGDWAKVFGSRATRSLLLPFLLVAGSPVLPVRAQDTTSVMRLRGLRVEVPRPSTTTGGTSAVEIATDSLSVVAAPTAEELLRRMPLIQVRANSRGEVQPDFRGADDRQIAILVDGVPITLGWDHRTDLSVIPLTAVRSVTLLRGLSSMTHGPNVLGGALEFNVAREPWQQSAVQPFTGAFSIDQQGGSSMDATVGTSIAGQSADWVLRAGAGYRNNPGVQLPNSALSHPRLSPDLLTGDDGLRLNSDRRLADGFLAMRYDGDRGSWFSTLFTASDGERGVPPEAHVTDPRLWRYPDQSRLLIAMSGGTGEWQTGFGSGDLEATLGVDRTSTEIEEYGSSAFRDIVDGETGTTTTVTGRLVGDHRFSPSTDLRSALTIANVSHAEAFADGQAFDYRQRLWSLGSEFELGNWDLPGTRGGSAMWTLGASLDGSDTPLSGDKPALASIWDWGMRTGVTVLGSGGNVLYHAGFSRRTRFPSLRELYSGALGRFEPNPELMPENLKAGEAGVTVTAGADRFQVVAFHQRLSDGIVRTSTVTPVGTRFKRVNRDEVRSTGLELLAAGTRGRFRFGGDLTLKQVRIKDPSLPGGDERAEYEPAVSGTLNLGLLAPRDVNVTSFVRYRGVQYCENVEVAGLDRMDSSATIDLEAGRVFSVGGAGAGRRIAGTIGVANLTDSTVLDQCGLPQPGRTLRIQFNIR